MTKTLGIAALLLGGVVASRPAHALVTTVAGAAYAQDCQAHGVPIPPNWGSTSWKFNGTLEKNQLFIVQTKRANVYYYVAPNNGGICMALPRGEVGQTIDAASFGVICQGSSGKVCFWDNRRPVPWSSNIVIASTNASSIPADPYWIGGTDLLNHNGGTCTDCHAGENPYIVHLGTPLDLDPVGVSQDSGMWAQPLVPAQWPQNVGPGSVPSAAVQNNGCLQCHNGGPTAGRFPVLSQALPGYCGTIMRTSYDRKVMPPFDPGTLAPAYETHWNEIFNACAQTATAASMPPSYRDAQNPAFMASRMRIFM